GIRDVVEVREDRVLGASEGREIGYRSLHVTDERVVVGLRYRRLDASYSGLQRVDVLLDCGQRLSEPVQLRRDRVELALRRVSDPKRVGQRAEPVLLHQVTDLRLRDLGRNVTSKAGKRDAALIVALVTPARDVAGRRVAVHEIRMKIDLAGDLVHVG